MRHPVKNKYPRRPDLVYQSEAISRFINTVMWDGKKDTATKLVYDALDLIKAQEMDPLETFETAIRNVSPLMEVRSRRVGGANYQVPREVPQQRRVSLAYRWLINAARSQKGKPMAQKLANEILLAVKNEGTAIKKKDDMHRMADANKAFAHFAW
ncbi:30S ribosomal protein S7 [Patescibacteria group bacterium]|nr:30S ribosomal protein S7 [Patescibacteria group bacterium]MBU1500559.1 30S ribosomal protein S7 [Patescibacteria group bacterium]MBU2080472.1 30S ribosomal protein S7 [Patescibacteria group bacterium]MBU2123723.1 30S ribosomal protein S7 [Patescibacteria group bacterium]MBU2194579.1 30S ribosomal protein S7 [Patescibacteria group bacterium]